MQTEIKSLKRLTIEYLLTQNMSYKGQFIEFDGYVQCLVKVYRDSIIQDKKFYKLNVTDWDGGAIICIHIDSKLLYPNP